MKKLLLSLSLFVGLSANAQLPTGSYATDFTVTAMQTWLNTSGMNNNGVYKLSDYLDNGYTVILDVSATWCGPCWNYHKTHVLDQLYREHGPAGQPGVNANTTDKVMVFWIDADANTSDATVLDGNGAIGNWLNTDATPGVMPANGTTGNVMFPMANPAATIANQISDAYEIAYFPTVYKICPNRRVEEVGQVNYANLVASIGGCALFPVSSDVDVALTSILSDDLTCSSEPYTPIAKVFNASSAPVSNVTVNFKQGGVTLSTIVHAGPIPAFSGVEITGPVINNVVPGVLTAEAIVAGDVNSANNTSTITIKAPVENTTKKAVVKITTDNYGAETGWYFRNLATATNLHLANFGTYSNGATRVMPPVELTLEQNTCYEFYIADRGGDGICCNYGQGSFSIEDGNGRVIVPFERFGVSFAVRISTTANAEIESITKESLAVFPNPATDFINVMFDAAGQDFSLELVDLQGRVMYSGNVLATDGQQKTSIPTAGMAAGTYIVKLSNANGLVTKKVAIQ